MSAVTTEQLVAVRNAIADLDRFVKASRAEDIGELMVAEEFAIATMAELTRAFASALKVAEPCEDGYEFF